MAQFRMALSHSVTAFFLLVRLLVLLTLCFAPVRHLAGEETFSTVTSTGIRLSGYPSIVTIGRPPVTLDERVWAMKFSADGKELFAVTDNISQIGWPSRQLRILWQPHGNETMTQATFSPDGTRFARSNNGNKVHVHETATGKLLHTFEGRDPRFTPTAWSPDGSRLAVGGNQGVVIHDLSPGNAAQHLSFGDADIAALDWSPDGRWIVAATEKPGERGGPIFLLLVDGSAPSILLPGWRDAKFSFSPDSSVLAVATEEAKGSVIFYLWDVKAGKEFYRQRSSGYNAIVHSPDGRFLAVSGLNSLQILDARTGREVCRHHADSINNHIWSVAFSPDGKILATGNDDRIRFRDTTSWNEIDPDESLRAPVSALAFTRDGRHLVSGGWNGDLVLWDWDKKIPVWKQLSAPEAWEIKSLSVDPLARWIGVVQTPRHPEKRRIRLLDFKTGEALRFADVERSAGAAPLFHPMRGTAYLATTDHSLVEWDCESGGVLRTIPVPFLRTIESGKHGNIDTLAFNSVKPEIVQWTAEMQAYGRIDPDSGAETNTIEPRYPRLDADPIPPRTHDFAAMGGEVWNLPTMLSLGSQNSTPFPSVRHPSGLLQFSSQGRTVQIFDIISQSFIHTIDFGPGEIKAIILSPDGRTLVAGTTGGLKYCSLEGLSLAEGTSSETLWQLMGGENHWQAYQAAWALARQPDFMPFMESHLSPALEPTADEIEQLKILLGDGSHEIRQSAARQWLDLGFELDRTAYETLREGGLAEKWPSAISLDAIPGISPGYSPERPIPPLIPLSAHRRSMRAIMILRNAPGEASRHHLERLAKGYPGAPLTKAAARALASQR